MLNLSGTEIKVGFASRPFSDCGQLRISKEAGASGLKQELHDEVYIRACVIKGPSPAESGIIISADTMDWYVDRAPTHLVKPRLSEEFGIPAENISLFTTHTHASVYPRGDEQLGAFTERTVEAVRAARDSTRIAEIGYTQLDLGPGTVFNRRVMIDNDYGAHCLMFNPGMEFRSDNTVEVTGQLKQLVEEDWGGAWPPEGFGRHAADIADGPVDPFMHLIFFREPGAATPFGGFLRMTGHAVIVSTFWTKNQISADYPGVICAELNQACGGQFLFLQGPAGDARPFEPENTFEANTAYGRRMAEAALAAEKSMLYTSLDRVSCVHSSWSPALHPQIPENEEICRRKAENCRARVESNKMANRPGWENKRLFDRADFYTFNGNRYARKVFNEDICRNGLDVSLLAWRLGPAVLACMPGEVFTRTAQQILCGAHPGLRDRLVTAELADHNPGYLPTREDIPLGGYEVNAAITMPGSAEDMARRMISMINQLK